MAEADDHADLDSSKISRVVFLGGCCETVGSLFRLWQPLRHFGGDGWDGHETIE